MSKALLFLAYLEEGKEVSCHSVLGFVVRVKVYHSTISLFKYS